MVNEVSCNVMLLTNNGCLIDCSFVNFSRKTLYIEQITLFFTSLKKTASWSLLLDSVQLRQGCRTTARRQFAFNQYVLKNVRNAVVTSGLVPLVATWNC